MSGADEIFELANDFGKAPAKVAKGLYEAYRGAGEGFRDDWQHNARGHFDGHAKHYPKSITTEMRPFALTSIVVETGPEVGGGRGSQGFLGRILEFGGEKSPAYLDGLHAMPLAEKRLERLADAAIGFALP